MPIAYLHSLVFMELNFASFFVCLSANWKGTSKGAFSNQNSVEYEMKLSEFSTMNIGGMSAK